MAELNPLIMVPPPPAVAHETDVQWWLYGAILVAGVLLLWRLRSRLFRLWLRRGLTVETAPLKARRLLKYCGTRLTPAQRRTLELIAFAPASNDAQVGQLKALLKEVCP